VWHNLLTLERELDRLLPRTALSCRATSTMTAMSKPRLRNPFIHAYVRDDGHAALVEFSSLAVAHNFGDTLRAYAEAYHAKIHLADASHAAPAAPKASPRPTTASPSCTPSCPATPIRTSGRAAFSSTAWSAANDMLRPLACYAPGETPALWTAGGEGWRIEKRYRSTATR
jgi:hypothetical protein